MIISLDTNILVYFEGINGHDKQRAILRLLGQLPKDAVGVPLQALCELHRVLRKKTKLTAIKARSAVIGWTDAYPTIETTQRAMLVAMDLCAQHQVVIWDALIMAVSADAGCRVLLSEDLHHGFTWHGLTVINPFRIPMHPLLESFLISK